MYVVHQNAKKPYQDIVKFHGFKGNIGDYIEIYEISTIPSYSSDDSSCEYILRKQKVKDKKKSKKKDRK